MNNTQDENNELTTAQIILKDLDVKGVKGVEALKKIEQYFNVWAGKTDSTEAERELCEKFGGWMKIVVENIGVLQSCLYLAQTRQITHSQMLDAAESFLCEIERVNKC